MAKVSTPLVLSWILTLCTAVFIFYQKQKIENLENELAASVRSRRSIEKDENLVYLPVYAQVSRKAMKRLCLQHKFEFGRKKERKIFVEAEEPKRKKCTSEVSFGDPKLISERANSIGSAMRDGEHWYLTEFDFGYTIMKFLSAKKLNISEPTDFYTLPIPFRGTDNTVYNKTFYYSNGNSLVAYNFKKDKTQTMNVTIGQKALYENSDSLIDIQAEEHGIWITYRDERDFFSVSRLHPMTLKAISNWSLPAIHPEALCNSFIRCGILYSVECLPGGITFTPVYDFYKHIYVAGRKQTFPDIHNVTMIQYDPNSKAIALFSIGNIFSIDINEKFQA